MNGGFTCSRCGETHPGPPLAYSSVAPGAWYELTDEQRASSTLDGELCFIEGKRFFVRSNVEIPVNDASTELVYAAWVELRAEDMRRLVERWHLTERAADPGYEGTLASDLAGYPETIGLAAEVQTREPGTRSRAVLPPGEDPLSIDVWEGVTMARVLEVAELLAHPSR